MNEVNTHAYFDEMNTSKMWTKKAEQLHESNNDGPALTAATLAEAAATRALAIVAMMRANSAAGTRPVRTGPL